MHVLFIYSHLVCFVIPTEWSACPLMLTVNPPFSSEKEFLLVHVCRLPYSG